MGWRRDGRGSSLYGDSTREYYAEYNEGLNFGYRWYDSTGAELIERADGTRDKWILAEGEREFTIRTSADDHDILLARTVDVR